MPQAQRLMLADIGDGAAFHVGIFELLQKIPLPLIAQGGFEFGCGIEIILERAFAAGSHKDEFLDTGRAGLVDRILDQGAINQRHDLLGNGFRSRKEARAEAGHGKDRLGDFFGHAKHPGHTGPAHISLLVHFPLLFNVIIRASFPSRCITQTGYFPDRHNTPGLLEGVSACHGDTRRTPGACAMKNGFS